MYYISYCIESLLKLLPLPQGMLCTPGTLRALNVFLSALIPFLAFLIRNRVNLMYPMSTISFPDNSFTGNKSSSSFQHSRQCVHRYIDLSISIQFYVLFSLLHGHLQLVLLSLGLLDGLAHCPRSQKSGSYLR